jgi:hypothetical protein
MALNASACTDAWRITTVAGDGLDADERGCGGTVLAIEDSYQAALDRGEDDRGELGPAEVVGDLRDVALALTADGALVCCRDGRH